jgi:hypothetical protein
LEENVALSDARKATFNSSDVGANPASGEDVASNVRTKLSVSIDNGSSDDRDEPGYWTPERWERYLWTYRHFFPGDMPDDWALGDTYAQDLWEQVFRRRLDGCPVDVLRDAIDEARAAGTLPDTITDWLGFASIPEQVTP